MFTFNLIGLISSARKSLCDPKTSWNQRWCQSVAHGRA